MEDLGVTAAGFDADFWHRRRVLVTGHTGFKGAWLSLWLERLGAQVSGFAHAPHTEPSLWQLAVACGTVRSTIGDINDGEALARVLAEHRPEIVFHLAAQSLVRRSYAAPEETFATNVVGIATLLKRVADGSSVEVVIIATSDKCYAVTGLERGFREDDRLGGRDPYSASKGCAEIAAASMRQSFFAPYAPAGHRARVGTVRAGNVIGGGDWSADRLIPDIVRGCLGPKGGGEGRVVIRSPGAIRPWQHVLEPLRGYMMLAQRLGDGEAALAGELDTGLNFGPHAEDERPVIEVAQALREALGTGIIDVQEDPAAPYETGVLRLDTGAAQARLGWMPVLGFRQAIAMTAQWYGGWSRGADMRDLTLQQIDAYSAMLKEPA